MKKSVITAIVAFALALCLGSFVGCDSTSSSSSSTGTEPPLMPASHVGRMDNLGVEGCYGCHGNNGTANPMLTTAGAIPEDHYVNGDSSTQTIEGVRRECITCHPQG